VGDRQNLSANQTKQDAIILNLQRACETSIDLAMYVISRRRLGLPQESRDAFILLRTAGILPADLATRMQHMVGFRTVAVHEYTSLNPRHHPYDHHQTSGRLPRLLLDDCQNLRVIVPWRGNSEVRR